MKGLFSKKNLISSIFTAIFISLAVLSPISYENIIFHSSGSLSSKNISEAADPIKVLEVMNMNDGRIQWVTEETYSKYPNLDWQQVGEKLVDPTTITNGVWQGASSSSDGYIMSLAKAIAGYIIKSILAVVYLVLWVVYSIVYGITMLAERILEIVLDPVFVSKDGYLGGFTTKEFVRKAAQLLANLCNMLYLFVLLYIAIKSMVGSSNTRNLLTKLVIAALLTNFGLVLAGVVIDFSQVAMYTVWEGIKGQSENFAPGTKILEKLQTGFQVGRSSSQIASLFDEAIAFLAMSVTQAVTEIIKISGLIITSLALTVTLFSIAIILIIRIVMLWVLLILTPVAFLFSILPQTEKHWNDWLETLTKYAFTGPILIFFLWLALKLSGSVTNADKLNQIGKNIPNNGDFKYVFFDLLAKNMAVVFEMLTIIITIWAGIIIANKFGIKGAKGIDGLLKSTTGLGKGLAENIPWYSGRAATLFSSLATGLMGRRSQRLTSQAEVAKSSGNLSKADALEKNATWWTNKSNFVNNQKNRAVKAMSVMNPMIMKKQFAGWWSARTKDYMEQSEASVDEFGRDTVRFLSRGKKFESEKAKLATQAKLNNIDREFGEKYEKLEKARVDVVNADNDLNASKLAKQPIITQKNNAIRALDNRIATSANLVNQFRQQLKNPLNLPPGVTPDMIRNKIKNEEEDKKHLEAEKNKLEEERDEAESDVKAKEEEKKLYESRRDSIRSELKDMGSSVAEISTTDEKEKAEIERATRIAISRMRGALPTGFSFHKELDTFLGNTGDNTILEKSRELAKKNTIEFMTAHTWQKEKFEKAVREKVKDLEGTYSPENLEDMAKSGYGDAITRTAIFRKLASSPRNFGNMLAKTIKDYNGDEKKAMDFLKQKYSEPELIKAFKAADTEARKSNNLFSIGYIKHDSTIGQTRITRGDERSRILSDFAKGMTPDNLNNINPQTFSNDEAVKQLSRGVDWQKLARNPRFVDNMSQKTRILFKNNQSRLEQNMSTSDAAAFRQIIKV